MLHNQNFKRDTRSQSVKAQTLLPSQSKRVFNTMRKSDMNKKEIVKNKNLKVVCSLSAQKTIELLSDSGQKEISKQRKAVSSSEKKKISKDEIEKLLVFLKEKIAELASHKKSIIRKNNKFTLLDDISLYVFINEQAEELKNNDDKMVEKILESKILQKRSEQIKIRYTQIIKKLNKKSLREIRDHIDKHGLVGQLYSVNNEIRIMFNEEWIDKYSDDKRNQNEDVQNQTKSNQKEQKDKCVNGSKDISFNGSKKREQNLNKDKKSQTNNPDSLNKFRSISKKKFASDDSETSFTVCLNSDEKRMPVTSTNKIGSKRKSYDSYHIASLKFNERNKRFLSGSRLCPCKDSLKQMNNMEQVNKNIIDSTQPEVEKFDSDIYPVVKIEKNFEKISRQVMCPEIENEMRDLKDLVDIVASETNKPKEEIIEILESVSGEAQDLVKALNEGNHRIRWTEIDDQVLREANHFNLEGLKLLVKYKGRERVEKRIKFKNLKLDWDMLEI